MEGSVKKSKIDTPLFWWHVSVYGVPGNPFKYLRYDTYSDFVVVAATDEEARNYHPTGHSNRRVYSDEWVKPEDIPLLNVTLLGTVADPEKHPAGTVICASFHAG